MPGHANYNLKLLDGIDVGNLASPHGAVQQRSRGYPSLFSWSSMVASACFARAAGSAPFWMSMNMF